MKLEISATSMSLLLGDDKWDLSCILDRIDDDHRQSLSISRVSFRSLESDWHGCKAVGYLDELLCHQSLLLLGRDLDLARQVVAVE